MSFGFSAGDIVLIGQLAYQLCSILRKDSRAACRELSNTLFGLRCAVDHLGRQAKETTRLQEVAGEDATRMRDNLDTLISTCATTLLELEHVVARYKGRFNAGEENDQAQHLDGLSASMKSRLARLSLNARLNWTKIKWSSDTQTFVDFRVKLQTQTESINMVLNTLLWSASQRIETAGVDSAEKLDKIEKQSAQSNVELLKLVQAIHATAAAGQQDSLRQASLPIRAYEQPQKEDLSAEPRRQESSLVEGTSQSFALSAIGTQEREELSTDIRKLNQERLTVGAKEFQRFGESRVVRNNTTGEARVFLDDEQPTQLITRLQCICNLACSTGKRNKDFGGLLKRKTALWLQDFEHVVDYWEASPRASKEEKQRRIQDSHTILLTLNQTMAAADRDNRRMLYSAMAECRIGRVFGKLRSTLRSVIVEKEIECFEDEGELVI